MNQIPLNKAYLTGQETSYVCQAIQNGNLAGNGEFTQKCHHFFCETFGFDKVLLTTSCTDALEMAAILSSISPGDEVIVPSFTFPSTANAFLLRGAQIVFADSTEFNPNLDISTIEPLITKKTRAIVPVHYAGIACDMNPIMELAQAHNLFVIEDAAHAIDSCYNNQFLGKIGDFGTFSFHATKNLSSGEGGMLTINNQRFAYRSEIVWEKGTNRSALFRGEVDKYGWMDIGSSYSPSDLIAAFLYAQLENMKTIQNKRIAIWERYFDELSPLAKKGYFSLPSIPAYATNNGHIFYLLCRSEDDRQNMIHFLKSKGIAAAFHYLPLHRSAFYSKKYDRQNLPHADFYGECLLRLPLYPDLSNHEIDFIVENVAYFFDKIG